MDTDPEIKKLQEEIISEGIHKRNYSSAESDSDSCKSIIMKCKSKGRRGPFDAVAYSFIISNKLSKTRSELSRIEERLRYLQLDYTNKDLRVSELMVSNHALRLKVKGDTETIKVQENRIKKINFKFNLFVNLFFVSFILNLFFLFNLFTVTFPFITKNLNYVVPT